ncbi:MAG: DUF1295 domain-containing protein [Acidimicrobiales bacterium]
MTGLASGWFLSGLGLTAGVVAVIFLVTWWIGVRVGRWNVVDVTWGLSFAAVAVSSFVWSAQVPGGNDLRRGLVLVLTSLWGLRLAGYIWMRSRGKGEDPRYAAIIGNRADPTGYALRVVFAPQAVLSWLVSTPVQIAMYQRSATGVLIWCGTAVWVVGLFFEAVGDTQLAAFRREPGSRDRVMDRGLWRYTRHPNYFGDAAVWTGLFLVGAERWPGVLTFVSPLAMLYFLYFKSGKGLLERQLAKTRPGYREYMDRTSGFIPWPPSRSRQGSV